ncbi:MAG: hypothetical protein JJ974_04620 [Phycisphaerales bacterium]|nr:hypothetical protein [Phycisphaerales bacterium]
MSIEAHIIGLTIDHVLEIHDYIQIYFTNGDIMNLNNRYECQPADLESFKNEVIDRMIDDDSELVLITKSGFAIRMGMLYKDVNGPEAAEFYRDGSDGEIIIWEQVN